MEQEIFAKASAGLRSVVCSMGNHHVNRNVVNAMYEWIRNTTPPINSYKNLLVLKGKAGSGKTVALHDLQEKLLDKGITVLGLKSDLLFQKGVSSIDDAVGFNVIEAIREKALNNDVVLLVDQIDALSNVLSTNRTPISAINGLIQDVLKIEGVRVVVSCRPYDFDYDSSFDWMRKGCCMECDLLSLQEVEETLQGNMIDYSIIDKVTKDFLRTPLYLSIYCRLTSKLQSSPMISRTKLYESWINQIIIDKVPTDVKVTIESLTKCLDFIVSKMISEQELTIPYRAFQSQLLPSRNYLIREGVLASDEEERYIQFPHQTLLDYIYARLFFENGHTLDNDFRNTHQGLFVRPRMKYVLDYIHEVDSKKYIQCLQQIVGEKRGHVYSYHYHLRHLAISSLASYDKLSSDDKRFIVEVIYTDKQLYDIYKGFVHHRDHLELLFQQIERFGGLTDCGTLWVERLIEMMQRLSYVKDTVPTVVDKLLSVNLSELSEESKRALITIINHLYPIDQQLKKIKPFVEKLDTDPIKLDAFDEYYKRLIACHPDAVKARLEKFYIAFNEENSKDSPYGNDVNYSIKEIVNQLKEKQPETYLKFGRFVLLHSTDSAISKEDEIRVTKDLIIYNRQNDHFRFVDTLLSDMMDVVERRVESQASEINQYLEDLSKTDVAACHIVAIVGWIRDIQAYKDIAYTYLRDNINKKHHSDSLYFYQKELFGGVFVLLSEGEQDVLMGEIGKLDPDWEHMHISVQSKNRQYPMTRVGYTRGQYYSKVPREILKQPRFYSAYKELQELLRKYHSIENTESGRMTVHQGWTAMPNGAYENMLDENILQTMEQIRDDCDLSFEKATMTGHAMKLAQMAKEDPNRFYNIYMIALENDKIPVSYITEGFSSIFSGVEKDKSQVLLSKLIDRVGLDVNHMDKGLLMSIIRLTDLYSKQEIEIPNCLFDFLIIIATDYDETGDMRYDAEHHQAIDINIAINRVRGAAVTHLIESFYAVQYREKIVSTFESIADHVSPITKCAMLFQLAFFVNYDRERTLNLFLRLTKDCEDELLCLPAHNLNPLYYITPIGFSKLVPYFEHCLSVPKSHAITVNFLFRSWLGGEDTARDMCIKMGETTVEAAARLIELAKAYYDKKNKIVCDQILNLFLESQTKEIGFAYDHILRDIKSEKEIFSKDFLNRYFQSNACAFATHNVYDVLRVMADEDSRLCLKWLCGMYKMKQQYNQHSYRDPELINILLIAYKRIQTFNLDDELLEFAISLLDEVLSSGEYTWQFIEQLQKLEE